MKKLLLFLCVTCVCLIGAAQGVVNFFNNPMTLISGMNGAPATGAESYYFALLTAPVGTTDPRQFTFTGCYATNQASPGRINGGWNISVTDWAAGTERAFIVCGWPANAGHNWNQNWLGAWSSTGFGMSMIATGIAGGWNGGMVAPPLNLFGGTAITSGFMVSSGCLGPYWMGFWRSPTNQTVVVGGSAVFDVAAIACPPPRYQWYLNEAPIPGAIDGFYRITNAQPADAGTYSVILSNPDWPPCCGTQRATAILTVLIPPIPIASQPQNQTVFVGSIVHLAVSASGPAPLSYQWFFNGGVVAGGTNSDLWLTNVQVSGSGPYTVVVSNLFAAMTSSPAILTVLTRPPTQGNPPTVTTPSSTTAEIGSLARFHTRAVGDPPFYFQWFFNNLNAIPGGTNSTLELPGVQLAQTGPYMVAVTNAFGAVTSTPAELNVIVPVEHRVVPGLLLTGQAGSTVNLDYANDVNPAPNWTPLAAVAPAGQSQFYFDLTMPLPPQRFYRTWQTGFGGVPPTPALGLVPALTLTGAVGSSVRLDYINQFGPTDAWLTIETVTLTNTSQLFFDTSAISQAPRLWRVVPLP